MIGLRGMLSDLLSPRPALSAVPHLSFRDDDPSAGAHSSLENPATPWDRIFDVERTHAGKNVSEITSLQLAAVWRCVNIIAGTLARVPFLPYSRDAKGRTVNRGHYLFPLLMVQANPWMTAYRFKRIMQTRVLLYGNAYALTQISGRGQVTALWPLRPDRVKPVPTETDGEVTGIRYRYTTTSGQIIWFKSDEILHIRGLETDGIVGLSPIRANRQSIGLSMAAEEYGARFFGQGHHPGGYIKVPVTLSPQGKKNLLESKMDLEAGLNGAHKLAVLDSGATYEGVAVPPEDIQFLQTRQFQAIDIARLFGVPPHMIAELSRATFSNIEQQGIDFVTMCMDDWFVNWEQECTSSLLSEREGQSIELDFYEQKLLRGDMLTRYKAYAIGRVNTFMSPNDILEAEGQNRIDEDWADEYLLPPMTTPAGGGVDDSDDPDVVDDPEDLAPADPPANPGPVGSPDIPGVAPLKKKEKKNARHLTALNGHHR